MAGIVYRNIRAEDRLEVPRSKWSFPRGLFESDQGKIPWDFQIQTDTLVTANQGDILVENKQQRTAVVIDVAIPRDRNIEKEEAQKNKKFPRGWKRS